MSSGSDLRRALEASGLRSGGTVSFHHHLRNGDAVLNATLDACAALGLRDLTVAASSIFPCHAPMIDHIASGCVGRIVTSYMVGPVADAISLGRMRAPVTFQTHGGRAHAITSGALLIDLAVIAAPAFDAAGNLGGADGPNACGPLGYAMVDATYAGNVLAVSERPPQPLRRVCISAEQIHARASLPTIGDADGLQSGTTARAAGSEAAAIAALTAQVIEATGHVRNGLRFQVGAGATALRVAKEVGKGMAQAGVRGRFIAGGITQKSVKMHQSGLFERLHNVQSFDRAAVEDYAQNPQHIAMSAAQYASPSHPDPIAQQLDVVVLGAAEVDLMFNVNVTTTSQGRIIGGSGGHADTAAGAALTIVTMPLRAKGAARVVQQVRHITTPGSHVDVLVTEVGLAVNPARPDLVRDLSHAGLPVMAIEDLCRAAGPSTGHIEAGRLVAVSEAPDGTITDHVYQSDA